MEEEGLDGGRYEKVSVRRKARRSSFVFCSKDEECCHRQKLPNAKMGQH